VNGSRKALPPQAQEMPADSALKRDMPLVPADSIAGRALVIVIAIMTFLACLTACGAILVANAAQGWRSDVSRDVTIQVKPATGRDLDAEVAKALEAASSAPGVAEARAYTKQESEKLLEPWLGGGLDLGQLPIPRLIVVRMNSQDANDLVGLREALATKAPSASLDDHRLWLSRLNTMANAVVALAVALFLLMISAMAMSIGFATRGAMAGNREIIEVLHFVGAADSYISRQFQNHFLRLGLKGGLIGGAGAAGFFALASILSRVWAASSGGEEISALFGAFALGLQGYIAIWSIAVIIALLTGLMSRIIVFRHLRGLQ
jgi:cell division transport system permease protein